MEPTGSDQPVVYMLGEAPGRNEDEQGIQFIGDSGDLIRSRIPPPFKKRLRWNNVVRTRPPKNETPEYLEIECFPGSTVVSSVGGIKTLYRRWYNGPAVTLETARGNKFTVTPNHPVFSRDGLTAAKLLVVGDDLVYAQGGNGVGFAAPDRNDKPTSIAEVFDAASEVCEVHRAYTTSLNFHGDGEEGYVDIIRTDRLLGNGTYPSTEQLVKYKQFFGTSLRARLFKGLSSLLHSRSVLSVVATLRSFLRRGIRASELTQILKRFSLNVQFDKIVSVETVSNFRGHVYNLETESGAYIAENLLVHNCCRPSIIRDIEATKPKAIFGFGAIPLNWILGSSTVGIFYWRGRRLPVKIGSHSCWYYPFVHPSYLIRQRNRWATRGGDIGSEDERAFAFDLERAFDEVEYLPEAVVYNRAMAEEGVEVVTGKGGADDYAKVIAFLDYASGCEVAGLDWETHKLRRYDTGAQLLTAAVSVEAGTVAFPVDHPRSAFTRAQQAGIRAALKKFLMSTYVIKAVHNLSFEQEWSALEFGLEVLRAGQWADTMSQASTLDERVADKREGCLSLNFLCKQNFGLDLKGLSTVNPKKLIEEPLEATLKYNGMDSKFHRLLYEVQNERLEAVGLVPQYEMLCRRIPTVVLSQIKGVPRDHTTTKVLKDEHEKQLKLIDKKIANDNNVQRYPKVVGRGFNPAAPKDVVDLFVRVMQQPALVRKPEGTGYTSDEKVLEKIKLPIAKLILERRKIAKQVSTYLNPLLDGAPTVFPDERLHPSINTVFAETWRLSIDSPSMQNWPKRFEGAKQVRRPIRPKKGFAFAEFDQGQIEARVIAMASKDPTFVKMLWERYDVHMEWAERLSRAYPQRVGGRENFTNEKVMKDFRQDVKNQWTFPLFFGAQLARAAAELHIPEHAIQHEYREFWRIFSGIQTWQHKVVKAYEHNGYVELLTGHRRHAPLSRQQVINSPIQGTTAFLVMDTMNRISELEDMAVQPILQVHDSLVFEWPTDNRFDDYTAKVVPEMLRADFDFINVPLTVEQCVGYDWETMVKAEEFWSDTYFSQQEAA